MLAYHRTWTGLAAVVTAAGLFAAFRGFASTTLLGMFLAAGVLVVMWVLPFLPTDAPMVKPLARAGLVGGLLTWVVMGSVRVVGPVGVPIVLVLLATSPPVVGWCSRLLHRTTSTVTAGDGTSDGVPAGTTGVAAAAPVVPRPRPEVAPAHVPRLEPPDSMSDAELCQAWRRSFVALRWATTPAARLSVVDMRARYLDELERRAGPQFHAWLESGARAAGDPSRVLDRRDHDADHGSAAE